MLSFWERQSLIRYDALVIGGGLTGLWTALSIKALKPHTKVLVLDSGIIPTGASTKNAGFACFGSPTEILEDIEKMGESQALELVEKRWRGLIRLRKEFGDEIIDFQRAGGYEVGGEELERALEKLDYLNGLLKPIFKQAVFKTDTENLKQFGFKGFSCLVRNSFEGYLDTGKLMDALWSRANHLGIRLITGCKVLGIEEKKVFCNQIEFEAEKIFLCTNAFAKQLNPQSEVKPGRGIVLVTKPLEKINFKGSFHLQAGYYYFRDLGNRVLLGGGRNLDFETESTYEFGINPTIMEHLYSLLRENILGGVDFEVEHTWAGIMGFGNTKWPSINKQPFYYQAVGMGGMGVALSGWAGAELAKIAFKNDLLGQ